VTSSLLIIITWPNTAWLSYEGHGRKYTPTITELYPELLNLCLSLWFMTSLLFSNQLVNPATLLAADDAHHDVIPPTQSYYWPIVYFQQTYGIHAPVGKRKGCSLSGRRPAPIADSSNVAKIARKHIVLNLWEINRNNTHTALAPRLTYYGWVSLIL
jgi:hypothetical protein